MKTPSKQPESFESAESEAAPLALRRSLSRAMAATVAMFILAGCEAIGTIFEAGVWVGVIVVIGIVAIVAVVVSLFRR